MRLRRPLPAVQGDTLHIVGVGDNRIGKLRSSSFIEKRRSSIAFFNVSWPNRCTYPGSPWENLTIFFRTPLCTLNPIRGRRSSKIAKHSPSDILGILICSQHLTIDSCFPNKSSIVSPTPTSIIVMLLGLLEKCLSVSAIKLSVLSSLILSNSSNIKIVAREKPRHGLFSIPSRCFEVIVFARFRGFGLETLQFGKRNLRDSLSRRGVILCPLQGRRDSHEALSKATVGNGRSVPLAA